jgi:quinol-cytochrome oxidoreductase complex cytochrome b subunit
MLSFFSGTVIKWDQEGYEALHHYKAVVGMLGPLGMLFGEGLTESISLNVRMYTFHITLAPLLLVFLIACHFYLIHVFNISPLPHGPAARVAELPPAELTSTFTEDIKSIIRSSLIFYGLVAVLSAILPAPLGGEHSPEFTGAKPPWVFLWQYGIEHFTEIPGYFTAACCCCLFFLLFHGLIEVRAGTEGAERCASLGNDHSVGHYRFYRFCLGFSPGGSSRGWWASYGGHARNGRRRNSVWRTFRRAFR